MKVEPVILESARKHGIADEDILHAYRNPIATQRMDQITMLVGPARSAVLLEVGVVAARGAEGLVIVHAMPARSKFLR
ncbi:MAG: hypothetical protein L0K86_22270 [Actinomycetia bacterium]|nr:hypothetical protein [Actinomycetes bacterium]